MLVNISDILLTLSSYYTIVHCLYCSWRTCGAELDITVEVKIITYTIEITQTFKTVYHNQKTIISK